MAVQSLEDASVLDDVELGLGAWAWGDRFFWGYGDGYDEIDVWEAFAAGLAGGVRFFDTAEMYGLGQSERIIGKFMRAVDAGTVLMATKYMPLPWRWREQDLVDALRGSLQRLGLARVDLYQIHRPPLVGSVEKWADALADAVDAGLTRAVGVSNFDVGQMRRAHVALRERDIKLASNQVEYSLLTRDPERNGLLATCQELDIKLIAYSPLAQGLLTGKYSSGSPPPGIRGWRYRRDLIQAQPVVSALREIGEAHDGKTPAQVALNWVISKGAIPIPGAKNARQAAQNAAAMGWRLTAEELARLDRISDEVDA